MEKLDSSKFTSLKMTIDQTTGTRVGIYFNPTTESGYYYDTHAVLTVNGSEYDICDAALKSVLVRALGPDS